MRISILLSSVFSLLFQSLLASQLMAAEIRAEVVDLRPVFSLELKIDVTGVIEPGDSDKLQAIIGEHSASEPRDISISFNSPGGSLLEGLRMAAILREAKPIVSAFVSDEYSTSPECASACVLAYMGADLRYLGENAKIGVHQFSYSSGEIDAETAINIAQRLSSEIVGLMQSQGIDSAFFDRMANTEAHDIDWVDREDLAAWRVVNNGIFSERMEYQNLNGKVALYMIQEGILGTNQMTLYCDNGMIGYAVLSEPEIAMVGSLHFVLDQREYEIDDFEVIDRNNARTRVLFRIPQSAAHHMQSAAAIGARIHLPSRYAFYGFLQSVRDQKVSDIAKSCLSESLDIQPKIRLSGMRVLPNTDIFGYDLTPDGFRDVTFDWCKNVCLKISKCVAVSYVQAKRWCWPKDYAGAGSYAPGIVSAVRN